MTRKRKVRRAGRRGGRPAPGKEQPGARSRREAGSETSLPHRTALRSIRRRLRLLTQAEPSLEGHLALIDAPLPSCDAGYACHAAPAYTALGIARRLAEHLEHGPLEPAREVLVAEAGYLIGALRLVAAAELAREAAVTRLQTDITRQLEDLITCLGRHTARTHAAIAPGFDPELHAEIPTLYCDLPAPAQPQ